MSSYLTCHYLPLNSLIYNLHFHLSVSPLSSPAFAFNSIPPLLSFTIFTPNAPLSTSLIINVEHKSLYINVTKTFLHTHSLSHSLSCIKMKMKMKLIMSLLFILLLQLVFANSRPSKRSTAEITVMGFVYCDVCSNNTFSTHSYFMSGVDVRVVCRFKTASSSSGTREMVTFSANRTTNELGIYKVAITSLDRAHVDSLATSCQASLVGSSRSSSCNIPGYRTTTDQVVFKSKRSNLCIYGFHALNFRPFKRNLALCGKK